LRIGISGTFDVENYGDLLFPLVAEAELSRRLGRIELVRFSYFAKSPPAWPYTVTPLTELPTMAAGLDGMLIGGGDLIRFDKDIAPGYAPPSAALHHPTGYWLTPALIAAQQGCPVIWNAPGVLGEMPAWAEPLLRLAVDASQRVAVRDQPAKQFLQRFAGGTDVAVMPDTCFGVARLLKPGPSKEFRRLCKMIGLTEPYLVVQATEDMEPVCRMIGNHPAQFADYSIIALPVGPVLGDDDAILGKLLPNIKRLPHWPHPLLIAELIRRAAGVVGRSLHLGITALACGIPMFRPAAIFYGKYQLLAGFEHVYPFGDDIDADWFTARLGAAEPEAAVVEANRQLDRHWDAIAAIFSDGRTASREVIGRFWQSLPVSLDAGFVAGGKRDAVIAERDEQISELHDLFTAERDQTRREIAEGAALLAAASERMRRQTVEHEQLLAAERERARQESAEREALLVAERARANQEIAQREAWVAAERERARQEAAEHEQLLAAERARACQEISQREAWLTIERERAGQEIAQREAWLAAERERTREQAAEHETLLTAERERTRQQAIEHETLLAAERERVRQQAAEQEALLTAERERTRQQAIEHETLLAAERESARQKIVERDVSLAHSQAEAAARARQIAGLYNSTSWKISLPVRWAGRAVRRQNSGQSRRRVLDFDRIARHPMSTEPYAWSFVNDLYRRQDARALVGSYPHDKFKTVKGYDGEKGYEYEARALIHLHAREMASPEGLSDVWRRLGGDLLSADYRAAMSRLTGIDLSAAPMEAYVCHFGPGAWLGPHLDLKDKILTHVLYFNQEWDKRDGGCLEILGSRDMSDVVAEIPPLVGNSSVLVRSDNSWHCVSRVVEGCVRSRRSMNVIFYHPSAASTMWPAGDAAPLHDYAPPEDGPSARS
jgi:hypothetical protein